jgi:hypothetical protein
MKPTAPLRSNFCELATHPAVAYLFFVRRLIAIFAIGLALAACVSRDIVYQRSLAAPHPEVPEPDFDQVAKILSHRTHQSITSIKTLQNDEVSVHVAFPGEQDPASGDDFVLIKCDGRWHILNATNSVID